MHHPSGFCTLCTFWILYLWCFIHFWIIFSLFLVHVSCLHCVGEDKKNNKKTLISLQWETQIRHLGSGSISWVTEACSTLCQGFCKQGQSAVSIVIPLIRSTRPIHSVAKATQNWQRVVCCAVCVHHNGSLWGICRALLSAVVPICEAAQSVRQQHLLLWR